MLYIQPGKVISYKQGRGVVELRNGNTLSLGSTYFHSGRPAREPMMGDRVEVISSVIGATSTVLYARIRRDYQTNLAKVFTIGKLE